MSARRQPFAVFPFPILDDGSTETAAIVDRHAAKDTRVFVTHRDHHPERPARRLAFLDAHPDHGPVGTWVPPIDGAGRLAVALLRALGVRGPATTGAGPP